MSVKLRERKLPSGRTVLFLDIYHKGIQRREALGLYLTSDRKRTKKLNDSLKLEERRGNLKFVLVNMVLKVKTRSELMFFNLLNPSYSLKSERTTPCY